MKHLRNSLVINRKHKESESPAKVGHAEEAEEEDAERRRAIAGAHSET